MDASISPTPDPHLPSTPAHVDHPPEAPVAAAPAASSLDLQSHFARVRQLTRTERASSASVREAQLAKLRAAIVRNQDALIAATSSDFGHRSPHETRMAELLPTLLGLDHARAHLREWMQPQPRPISWLFQPASGEVQFQPLGVVGIVSPWNYPFFLAMGPLIAAIAAGNRVLIKPSEVAPATARIIHNICAEAFGPDEVAVFEGGVDVATAFCKLPFDHLLFTGSTQLGRVVMRAAAENLTPVTLELGGKSPVILHPDHPIAHAAERVAIGKLMNAGQTCVAPDYVLVHRSKEQAFVDAFVAQVRGSFPTLLNNPDYTAIINQRHWTRLRGYLQEARDRGATLTEINPANEEFGPETHKLPPTVAQGLPLDAALLQDEIFGPILPVIPYDTLDEAIAFVNERPRPLALYYFDRNSARCDDVLARTTSGGVTLNDTVLHVAQEELPFGGVGPAGMGAYHGEAGFVTFSHRKSVLRQARLNSGALLNPPYGKTIDRLLAFLLR